MRLKSTRFYFLSTLMLFLLQEKDLLISFLPNLPILQSSLPPQPLQRAVSSLSTPLSPSTNPTSERKNTGLLILSPPNLSPSCHRGSASGALRIYYTVQMQRTPDYTAAMVPLGITSSAEMASMLLCVCMPAAPRLFRYLRAKLRFPSSARPPTAGRTPDSPSPSPRLRLWRKLGGEGSSSEDGARESERVGEGSRFADSEKGGEIEVVERERQELAVPPPTMRSAWLSLSETLAEEEEEEGKMGMEESKWGASHYFGTDMMTL